MAGEAGGGRSVRRCGSAELLADLQSFVHPAVELLDANLKDEKETLREVERIATRLSNESAKQAATA